MSDAVAAVLFPTGQVRWTIHQGSSDTLWPRLHDTWDAAWDSRRDPDRYDYTGVPPDGTGVPVLICSHYGSGTVWQGTATTGWVTSATEYAHWPPNPWAPRETWPPVPDRSYSSHNLPPMPPYWDAAPRWGTPGRLDERRDTARPRITLGLERVGP